ncbi:MAG: GDSL-type esterase/lipase family protein [Mycoplasmatales bacterium]
MNKKITVNQVLFILFLVVCIVGYIGYVYYYLNIKENLEAKEEVSFVTKSTLENMYANRSCEAKDYEYENCYFYIDDYSPAKIEKKVDNINEILQKNNEIKENTTDEGYTVLIGDSITYNIQNYMELNKNIIDIGIPGATSYDIYKELNDIYFTLPTKNIKNVIITLGTNDFVVDAQYDYYSLEYTVSIINEIVKRIKVDNPNINIYVLSTFVTNEAVKLEIIGNTSENIKKLDELLKNKLVPNAEYINLNPYLEDKNGNLKEEYTIDGLHLNKKGYEAIIPELNKRINY